MAVIHENFSITNISWTTISPTLMTCLVQCVFLAAHTSNSENISAMKHLECLQVNISNLAKNNKKRLQLPFESSLSLWTLKALFT